MAAQQQGRGSGAVVLAAAVLLCVLLHAHVAESAVFTVGDRGGWSFNTNTWTNGKRFKAGDVLGTTTTVTSHLAASSSFLSHRSIYYAAERLILGRSIEPNGRKLFKCS
jgi:hypothetical protein